MNVPQLRFKEFKDSNNYKTKLVADIAKIAVGRDLIEDSFSPVETETHKYPIYSNTVENYGLYGFYDFQEFEGNSLTVVGRGAGLGMAFARKGGFAAIGRLLVVFPKQESFDVQWLTEYINFKMIIHNESGGIPQLPRSTFEGYSVVLPTLSEQTKIANFLTTIDERINQLSRKKELMTQYKQGVMQHIFSQQLRFKDDNGEDFGAWEEKNGNFLFAAISNKDHNSDLPILAITQEHGAIPRDLIDYRVSVSDKSVETYKVVEVGDFIISLRSFQGGIEYSNYKGICSPAYLILRSKTQLNSYFYKSYFKTPEYITKLNQHLEGIRDGKMVSYKQFSEILLPLPCLAEQTKIANFLTALDEKIQHITQQIEATKQYKQGLLQQMFV